MDVSVMAGAIEEGSPGVRGAARHEEKGAEAARWDALGPRAG